MEARRRWVLAPVVASAVAPATDVVVRSTTPQDDEPLARLLDDAYTGSDDVDDDTDHDEELRTWRAIDGADDDASRVAIVTGDDRPAAACLIGRELGAPFLYEVVTASAHRRRGLAAAVLRAALVELTARDPDLVAGWVTAGNEASERLLATHGFVPVTPPMREAQAIGLYRAARAVRELGVPGTAALAVASDDTGPTLYVVGETGPPSTVDVGGTSVRVERVGEGDPRVRTIADTAVPLRRAGWLLAHRTAD